MSITKAEAIVLRGVNYGETSKILTLYSREFGRLSVIAKGSRNVKSRFGGNLEPMNHLSIVFYVRENRDLYHLNQAELLQAFAGTRKDLQKTALAMATCELLDKIEAGSEANPLLFRLLLSTLRHIDLAPGKADNIFRAFELHLCAIMGFRPHFADCVSCHGEFAGQLIFDLLAGGLVCDNCYEGSANGMKIRPDTFAGLQYLQKTHISKLRESLGPDIVHRQIDEFLFSFLRYHIEGLSSLKSLRFFAKIA